MKFSQYVKESFNSKPVKFKKEKKNDFLTLYTFKVNDDSYTVDIYSSNSDLDRKEYEVSFDLSNSSKMELTNKFDQYKVLSTVIAIVKDFIDTTDVKKLSFTASKIDSKNRSNVYKRLVSKHFSNSFNIRMNVTDGMGSIYDEFVLIKK